MAKKVFLSYKRNANPDEQLAHEIRAQLAAAGHSVFIDIDIRTGLRWAEEIERQISECSAIVVFLTAVSSRSEMVQSEIEMARRFQKTILPVRVAFAGKLPHPLNAFLDPIQYAEWRGPSDTAQLIENLRKALDGISLPETAPSREPESNTPLPPAPGGAIDIDDPFYIQRPQIDKRALTLAAAPKQTIVLKGPRQMGKTSLLFRMINAAQNAGKAPAFVDFQLFESACLDHPATFYQRFTAAIAEELKVSPPADPKTPHDVTLWMEREVLQRSTKPVSLAIDESERALWAKFREDFFGMLRAWHNLRASPTRPVWKELDLFLVTSTEPALFIQGAQSPFNVGTVLYLTPFNVAEVAQLNQKYGKPLSQTEVESLRTLVGGQPYLISKALYEVSPPSPNLTPAELFATAAQDDGPFRDHLKRFMIALQEMPDVLEAFKEILQERGCQDDKLAYRLEAAGLALRRDGRVVIGSPLYRDFFKGHL